MSNQPHYKYEGFLVACKSKYNIRASYDAIKDAREFFDLPTEESIFDFISNNGLEELTFQDVQPWRNNPRPTTPIFVDAYGFKTSMKRGYIAFLYIPYKKVWFIKSFKPNRNQSKTLSLNKQKNIMP